MTSLLISLLSGAAGGNVVAKLVSSLNQGLLVNSIAGIAGGGIGSQIIGALAGSGGGIISQIAGGGVGGGIVLWLVSLVRGMMSK